MPSAIEERLKSAREAVGAAKARIEETRGPVVDGSPTDDQMKAFEAAVSQGEEAKAALESAEAQAEALGHADAFSQFASGLSFDGKAGEVTPEDDSAVRVGSKALRATMEPRYKHAFIAFLRGTDDAADGAVLREAKAMREGVDTEGGYLVPADQSQTILSRTAAPTRLLGAVGRMTTSKDVLDVPVLNATGDEYGSDVRIAWHGEEGTTAEDVGLENWGLKKIEVHNGSFEIAATRPMIEDADFDLESFVVDKATEAYATGINRVIAVGTGIGQPQGIMDTGSGVSTFNVGNPATADGIIQFIGDLPEQYAEGASFLCNRSWAYQTMGLLKDTANNYVGLLQTRDAALAAARTEAVVGYPALFAVQVATAGAANRIACFADFKKLYALVERVALTVEPISNGDRTYRRANATGWYFRFRVGGRVLQPYAGRIAVQS